MQCCGWKNVDEFDGVNLSFILWTQGSNFDGQSIKIDGFMIMIESYFMAILIGKLSQFLMLILSKLFNVIEIF